jgi:hypothetical protein
MALCHAGVGQLCHQSGMVRVSVVVRVAEAPTASSAASHSDVHEPRFGGYNLDWCLTYGFNCGTPAADAYCQSLGYARSATWSMAPVNTIGGGATKVIGDGLVCGSGVYCGAFTSITCTH